ncbi:MAG TPA: aldo/keto reductase [Solirubrobacteraceae bacterium]|jgi:aryl-alcohol dehydrogenase-like predicted oxidoreductase|nr:aldo/keto reductase [Solirubrobacteraceae bacterium]
MDPTTTALGTWSGGRFMHFGEPLEEGRLRALLRPGGGIDTAITADVYGEGAADSLLGEALRGIERDSYCLVGAIGHDFYKGEREGAKGFPRFTDPQLRTEGEYAAYIRMATERSLKRIGAEQFDLLLLHNPDRTGYTSEAVWEGMRAVRDGGLTRLLGVAPGPANGFTLDVIDCVERFGETIDWAMIIFNPLEPWPGELVLDAAAAHDVSLIARVVDYGGMFHDDVSPGHRFAPYDHRKFRPEGWVQEGRAKLERMRPYAERHGLSMLQLACQWCLAQSPVQCVAPTLIQETAPLGKGEGEGGGAASPQALPRAVEDKRAELAALTALRANPETHLSDAEVQELRAIGDNRGCMALKGASPAYEGEPLADRWPLTDELQALAARWDIAPERDLATSR